MRQSWWAGKLAAQHKAAMADRVRGRDIPRWEAQARGRSGAWMSGPPVASLGLCLGGPQYSLLLRWHLGLPLLPKDCEGRPCGHCGTGVDVYGDHAVSCVKVGFGARHSGAQDFICRMLAQARLPHEREAHVGGGVRRPADILLRGWSDGGDLAVDLTVVHVCAPSRVEFAAGAAKVAVAKAEGEKRKESAALCAAAGCAFTPFVMDAWGGVHGAGKALWKALSDRCTAGRQGTTKTTEVGRLRQGLAVAVVSAVAGQLDHLLSVTAEPPPWWDTRALPALLVNELGNELDF